MNKRDRDLDRIRTLHHWGELCDVLQALAHTRTLGEALKTVPKEYRERLTGIPVDMLVQAIGVLMDDDPMRLPAPKAKARRRAKPKPKPKPKDEEPPVATTMARRSKDQLQDSAIELMLKSPKGVTHAQLRNGLECSGSTLARVLDRLNKSGNLKASKATGKAVRYNSLVADPKPANDDAKAAVDEVVG